MSTKDFVKQVEGLLLEEDIDSSDVYVFFNRGDIVFWVALVPEAQLLVFEGSSGLEHQYLDEYADPDIAVRQLVTTQKTDSFQKWKRCRGRWWNEAHRRTAALAA